jgi:prepilin peptidase CpaA
VSFGGLNPAIAPWVLYALLAVCLPIAVVTDVRSRKIYDVLTLPTLGLAVLARFVLAGWDGPFGMAEGLVGALIGFGVFGVMSRMGGMGMGDVKLMAAVGAILGWPLILAALAFVTLCGGLQALLTAIWTGAFLRTLKSTGMMFLRGLRLSKAEAPRAERQYVPYGVAIAAGTVWTVLWQPWIGVGS